MVCVLALSSGGHGRSLSSPASATTALSAWATHERHMGVTWATHERHMDVTCSFYDDPPAVFAYVGYDSPSDCRMGCTGVTEAHPKSHTVGTKPQSQTLSPNPSPKP